MGKFPLSSVHWQLFFNVSFQYYVCNIEKRRQNLIKKNLQFVGDYKFSDMIPSTNGSLEIQKI